MSGLTAIAATSGEQLAGTNASPVSGVREVSLAPERNLFEFLAQQAQSNSLANAPSFANPSALAGQVSRHLRGFMERANHQAETIGRKERAMGGDKDVSETIGTDQDDGPQLHPGPGRQVFTPHQSGTSHATAVESVSEKDYDYLIDAMARSMQFSIEAGAVMTGTGNVMHSFQSLLRGQ